MANLQRWDPFAGLTNMHSQIDDMFNNFFNSSWPALNVNSPAMDVYTDEDGKRLIAELAAPGYEKDDIEIQVHDGALEIRGEKHEKEEDKNGKRNYMMRESHTSFFRSVLLPKGADGEKVKASFTNGVLKVTIPLQELPAPKQVTIEAGSK